MKMACTVGGSLPEVGSVVSWHPDGEDSGDGPQLRVITAQVNATSLPKFAASSMVEVPDLENELHVSSSLLRSVGGGMNFNHTHNFSKEALAYSGHL